MVLPLHDVCCACIPAESLRFLAGIRCEPGVLILDAGQRVWVRWDAGNQLALGAVTPIPDCRLFVSRNGSWFPLGKHVPEDVPTTGYRPLDRVLLPAPGVALPPPPVKGQPVSLTLVSEEMPRPARALRCVLEDLLTWVDKVPNARLAQLRASHSGGDVLVLGTRLPELPRGRRFWGETVLAPLGYRVEPALPESALRALLGLAENDIALFEIDSVDVIAQSALDSMSRARLRMISPGRGR